MRTAAGRVPDRDVLGLPWGRPRAVTPPIEVFTMSELLAQRGVGEMSRVQRPLFHVTLVPVAGEGTHTVDFVTVAVRPGGLIEVHPGQVMQWELPPRWEGFVVAYPAPFDGEPSAWFPGAPVTVADVAPEDWDGLRQVVQQLRHELDRYCPQTTERSSLITALARVFQARVHLARRVTSDPNDALPKAYTAFRAVLEQNLGAGLTVEQLSARAGFSSRTITRACVAVTGRTAKQLHDERVVLEARRLMCFTDLTIARIAADLGFAEATNFTKVFRRLTGTSPSEARAVARAAG